VTISNLFDMKAIETKTFSSTLDAMTVGVLLVDEDLNVVHANAAAETMLSSNDPLQVEHSKLTLQSKATRDALETAVRQATRDEAALGQRGIGIPIRRMNGDPSVIHVLPLNHGDIRGGLMPRAAAALFVAPASVPPRLPTDALTLLYDLTPAESRVLELVCEGATQDRIGTILGIAKSTVKTHLLHVFEKTGASRQVDLVKLAASLSLPL
jgi:DNA-binding CsgD family transcriptional regulator